MASTCNDLLKPYALSTRQTEVRVTAPSIVLHEATMLENLLVMRLLLKWRSDLRGTDERGSAPLQWTVKLRNKEAAKLLLENKVDVKFD
jgi:ankyrin repeat protein